MRPEDLLARLEAGYEYDPMYGQLCNERDQLQSENRKLRELLAIASDMARDYDGDRRLLRELVRDVHALGQSGFDCTECPVSFISRCNDEYSGCEWVTILADRMRELGVEP